MQESPVDGPGIQLSAGWRGWVCPMGVSIRRGACTECRVEEGCFVAMASSTPSMNAGIGVERLGAPRVTSTPIERETPTRSF